MRLAEKTRVHVGWYAASFRFSVVSFQVFATARGWLVLNVEWKGHNAEWGRRAFGVQGGSVEEVQKGTGGQATSGTPRLLGISIEKGIERLKNRPRPFSLVVF